jgi:hypothetical protein
MVGPWQKLAAAQGWLSHCTIPAPCKGPSRDSVVCGTPEGWAFKKRRCARPKCIRHKGPDCEMVATCRKQEGIQQDHQADFRTGGCEVSIWDFHWVTRSEWLDIVEGLACSEMKEEITSSLRARDVGASTTLGTFAHTNRKGSVDQGWWWYTWTSSHQWVTWGQLEGNHREYQATGKEDEADHRYHMHSPRKRRNGGMPVGC